MKIDRYLFENIHTYARKCTKLNRQSHSIILTFSVCYLFFLEQLPLAERVFLLLDKTLANDHFSFMTTTLSVDKILLIRSIADLNTPIMLMTIFFT